MKGYNKKELFEAMPVPRAVASLAIPTIISQLINLIYNMVDAFFIGRTGNPYIMAATSLTLTMIMLHVAFGNLFGVGGGSLIARLMGQGKQKIAGTVSAFSFYSCMILALAYSLLMGIFLNPILRFLGASDATIVYAQQYTIFVVVIGSLPAILSLTLAHLLRNTGFSAQASIGLSGGGILNIILDPLFMFVILPKGYEVMGAAIATMLSNVASCIYLLFAFHKAGAEAPLRMGISNARAITKGNITNILAVGIPSAILTGLFDLANICVNILASAHSDLCLAAMGIVMKVERIPNAVNIGICQGMLPIVAYNFSSGNRSRMRETIRFSRMAGLAISFASIILLEILAGPVTHIFLSSQAGDAETVLITLGLATLFLRIRCLASPVQFINYSCSYCMQAMGFGRSTMLHAIVRELVFYIPFMFLLDRFFAETGLASALPVGEACGAAFALFLLQHHIRTSEDRQK